MRRKLAFCIALGTVTGIFQMLGMLLELMEQNGGIDREKLIPIGLTGLLWIAATACVCLLCRNLLCRLVRSGKPAGKAWKNPFVYQAVIMLCWLPCYVAYFPAIYSYDGEPQLIQYTTHAFDNHHPILHTLLLGWCYDLGIFLQNSLKISLDGMAVYSFLQMLALSGAFAYGIVFFVRRGSNRIIPVLLTLWFGLFPVHPLMAVSTTKDTLYTAFLTVFFFLLTDILLAGNPHEGKKEAALFAAALLMMLFRKNGVYLAAGVAVFLLIATAFCAWKKRAGQKRYGRLLGLMVCCIVAFQICDSGLMAATHGKQGEAAEALSIPIQQLARTFKSNQDTLSEEELEALYAYIPKDGLDNYRPYISDGVKQYFQNDKFAEDPAGFVKIWFRLLLRYPGSYATAFLYHTMGSWYPSDVSHSLVYQNWWRDRTGYFITDAVPVFAGDFVKKENLLPTVRDLYERIATDCVHQKFLLTKLLFSPALYCLSTVFLILALFFKKNWRMLIPCAAIFVNLLTVIAGPCILVRYVYPFMVFVPFLALFPAWPGPFCRESAPEQKRA